MNRSNVRAGSLPVVLAFAAALFAPLSAQAQTASQVPNFWFAGTSLIFSDVQAQDGDYAVDTADPGLGRFLTKLGATLSYDPGQRYIVISSGDRRTITFTLDDARYSVGGITQTAPFAPYARGSSARLPLVALARALYVEPIADGGTIVLQPQLDDFSVHTANGTSVVALHGASPLKFRRLSADGTPQLAIAFSGVGSRLGRLRAFDATNVRGMTVTVTGSARNPATVVTFDAQPNAVRLLQPASSPNEFVVAFAAPDAGLTGTPVPAQGDMALLAPALSASVPAATPATPPASLALPGSQDVDGLTAPATTTATVRAVDLAPSGAGVNVRISLGGPVTYEWHRLPDNRWFIDLHGAVLDMPGRDQVVGNDSLSGVRVKQYSTDPADVRVTLTLTSQRRVDVVPTAAGITLAVSPDDDFVAVRAGAGIAPLAPGNPGIPTAQLGLPAPVSQGAPPAANVSAPLSRLIVIDAGHGGSDAGASHNGLTEKFINLDIARRLRSVLVARGWSVRMTRDSDVDVYGPDASAHDELQARVDVANGAGARLFISIHCNSFTSSDLNGTTSYYYKPQDRPLAAAIQQQLIAALGTKDDGVRKENFYVIHHSTMPATLIETAFLSNPSDAALLHSPDVLQRIALAIADGIARYTKTPHDDQYSGDASMWDGN